MGRNNKKKNKGKLAETSKAIAVGNGEISLAESRDTASEQSYLKQNSSDEESQSVGFQESDAEPNSVNGVGGEKNVKQSEDETITWPNKETKVQLQEELNSLKEDVRTCVEKEADIEKTIEQLQSERDIYKQKETIWQVKLEELHNKVNTCLSTEATWVAKLEELQNEVNTCLLTEANLKEQFRILGEELSFKEASTKESILLLESSNKMLQEKVTELEESKKHLVQEKIALINNISLLQARVQKLEEACLVEAYLVEAKTEKLSSPEDENTIYKVKEDHSAEELVVGSKDIVAKENEPHDILANNTSLTTISLSPEHSSTNEPDKDLARANHLAGHDDSSGHAFESIPIHDATSREHLNEHLPLLYVSRNLTQHSSEDEIQVEEAENQPSGVAEEANTPLSDAPLIGAPFRLISFVAKYVSGADLVKDQGSRARR